MSSSDRGEVIVVGMGPGGEHVAGSLAEAGLDVIGIDHELVGGECPYWTNRDAIAAEAIPGSLIVLGGGAIGAELAQVFARFGVDVTVIEAGDRLLPSEEPETGQVLADVFAAEGIIVRTGVAAELVGHDGTRFTVTLAGGSTLHADRLLVTTGRQADLASLGLASAGIDDSGRWVPVDDNLRVIDGVWAVGDLTGKGAFTHIAMYQADIVIKDILGRPHDPADYRALPRVTFTDPEVGSVGISEQAARTAGLAVRVGRAQVPSTARGWIHKSGNEGLIKLVAGRRCRSRSARRRNRYGPRGRGSALDAHARRSRSGPPRSIAHHDLRVPDISSRRRIRAPGSRLTREALRHPIFRRRFG